MGNFLFGTIKIKGTNLRSLPINVQVWSYLMVFLPILCIPGYAIYKLIITPGKNICEVSSSRIRTGDIRFCSSVSSVYNEPVDLKKSHWS